MSTTGLAIVMPEADIKYTNMAPIWSKLRNKMDDLSPTLPDGTQGPIINDDYGQVAVVTMALTGEDFTARELENMAEDIADKAEDVVDDVVDKTKDTFGKDKD